MLVVESCSISIKKILKFAPCLFTMESEPSDKRATGSYHGVPVSTHHIQNRPFNQAAGRICSVGKGRRGPELPNQCSLVGAMSSRRWDPIGCWWAEIRIKASLRSQGMISVIKGNPYLQNQSTNYQKTMYLQPRSAILLFLNTIPHGKTWKLL